MSSTRRRGVRTSDEGCAFCRIARGEEAAHVVLERDLVVAFLDRRPLFRGHCLVVPRAHHVTLPDLPAGLVEPLFDAVRLLARAVTDALGADGSFVALNNVVSQSVAHLHVHVVPRRRGDGLRGFFWPRQAYASDDEAADVRRMLVAALERSRDLGPPSDGGERSERTGGMGV